MNCGSDHHSDEIAYYCSLHVEMNHNRLRKSTGWKTVRSWENVLGKCWIHLPCSHQFLGILSWPLLDTKWSCVHHTFKSVRLYLSYQKSNLFFFFPLSFLFLFSFCDFSVCIIFFCNSRKQSLVLKDETCVHYILGEGDWQWIASKVKIWDLTLKITTNTMCILI